jgi:4-amino-4-deoxy-L-arabinose transferase-like glycosyltransferase
MTTIGVNADTSLARLPRAPFKTPDIGEFTRSLLTRRYWLAASIVLLLSAFNLTFRLGHEIVVEWDESLYGVSAWEMFNNHQWIGTTFRGSLDYYNTKPPLNVWLICLAFKLFGANLIALRLPSILSAWLTVVVLQQWVRRAVGPALAVMSSLILGTAFGFIYDHAGRNANTDALFALLVLLTVVTLWSAHDRPSRLIWLGPIAAATFLLRGMGVLMPLAIAGMVEMARRDPLRKRRRPLLLAAALCAIPVSAWIFARWRLDQWRFLGPLFLYDFVARSFQVLEGHRGTPFYHLNALQKNQVVWLTGGIVASLLAPIRWSRLRSWFTFWRGTDPFTLVVGAWVVVTFLMPTIIRTKLSWYLNPFYPAFALGTAAIFVHGLTQIDSARTHRRVVLATVFILALAAAETRLMWYSVHRRNLAQSTQGFLLAGRQQLSGHGVFRAHWDNSELFVLNAIAGAQAREADSLETFFRQSTSGDFWLASAESTTPDLTLVRSQRRYWLYRRDR